MTCISLGTLCRDLVCVFVTSPCTLCGDLICVCVTSLFYESSYSVICVYVTNVACLIPLIAMSLDGVFRGGFAVDFSPFLPFCYLVLPSIFICRPRAPLQGSLRFPPGSDIASYYSVVQLGRGKVSSCCPSHSAFHKDLGEL